MLKSKYILIIISAAILLVVLLAGRYYYQNYSNRISDDAATGDIASDRKDDLLDSNEKAIAAAGNGANPKPRPITADDHLQGNSEAPVKILAYLDYSCEFSADLALSLGKIREEFGDRAAIAVRHFPLRTNPDSFIAALSLECAAEQGKFWEMHDKVYGDIRSGSVSSGFYAKAAEGLGLDMEQFKQCVSAENGREKIIEQAADADAIGVIGTPAMYINGEVHPGAVPLDDFVDSQEVKREGLRTIALRLLNIE